MHVLFETLPYLIVFIFFIIPFITLLIIRKKKGSFFKFTKYVNIFFYIILFLSFLIEYIVKDSTSIFAQFLQQANNIMPIITIFVAAFDITSICIAIFSKRYKI